MPGCGCFLALLAFRANVGLGQAAQAPDVGYGVSRSLLATLDKIPAFQIPSIHANRLQRQPERQPIATLGQISPGFRPHLLFTLATLNVTSSPSASRIVTYSPNRKAWSAKR